MVDSTKGNATFVPSGGGVAAKPESKDNTQTATPKPFWSRVNRTQRDAVNSELTSSSSSSTQPAVRPTVNGAGPAGQTVETAKAAVFTALDRALRPGLFGGKPGNPFENAGVVKALKRLIALECGARLNAVVESSVARVARDPEATSGPARLDALNSAVAGAFRGAAETDLVSPGLAAFFTEATQKVNSSLPGYSNELPSTALLRCGLKQALKSADVLVKHPTFGSALGAVAKQISTPLADLSKNKSALDFKSDLNLTVRTLTLSVAGSSVLWGKSNGAPSDALSDPSESQVTHIHVTNMDGSATDGGSTSESMSVPPLDPISVVVGRPALVAVTDTREHSVSRSESPSSTLPLSEPSAGPEPTDGKGASSNPQIVKDDFATTPESRFKRPSFVPRPSSSGKKPAQNHDLDGPDPQLRSEPAPILQRSAPLQSARKDTMVPGVASPQENSAEASSNKTPDAATGQGLADPKG